MTEIESIILTEVLDFKQPDRAGAHCRRLASNAALKICDKIAGDLRPATETVIGMLLRADGDRDHMNRSDITCEQSMAIAALLREWCDRTGLSLCDPAPFYGAQCPDYPKCNGGCGLGCTYEIVNRPPPHLAPRVCQL